MNWSEKCRDYITKNVPTLPSGGEAERARLAAAYFAGVLDSFEHYYITGSRPLEFGGSGPEAPAAPACGGQGAPAAAGGVPGGTGYPSAARDPDVAVAFPTPPPHYER